MPDTPAQPDRVAAYLLEVRDAARLLAQTNTPSLGTVPRIRRMIGYAERLAGAVEAAMAVVASWESKPAVLREARDLPPLADSMRAIVGRVLTEASAEMREAIAKALLGTDEASD